MMFIHATVTMTGKDTYFSGTMKMAGGAMAFSGNNRRDSTW